MRIVLNGSAHHPTLQQPSCLSFTTFCTPTSKPVHGQPSISLQSSLWRSRLGCARSLCSSDIFTTPTRRVYDRRNIGQRWSFVARRNVHCITIVREPESRQKSEPELQRDGREDTQRRTYAQDELFETRNEMDVGPSEDAYTSVDSGLLDGSAERDLSLHAWPRALQKVVHRQSASPLQAASRHHLPDAWHPSLRNATQDSQSRQELRRWWMAQSADFRSREWPKIMMWLLEQNPNTSLSFLLLSLTKPLPPAGDVAEVIELASLAVAQMFKDNKNLDFGRHLYRICAIVLQKYGEGLSLPQRCIPRITRQLGDEDRINFYRLLHKHKVHLQPTTLLHMSRFLVRGKDSNGFVLAVHAIRQALTEHDLQCPVDLLQLACAAVVRRTVDMDGQRSFDTMKSLRELGVNFDVAIYNALISNASDRQEYSKAWHLYDLLVDPDLQPDAVTFTILFKMCRRTNDFHAFRRLWREVRERSRDPDTFSVSPKLATEMMYSVWIWTPTQVERMLKVYRRYFDLHPLSTLGLLRETDPSKLAEIQYAVPEKDENRLDPMFYGPRAPPPPLAIVLVLMAFLRRPDMKVELLERIYGNFKRSLAARDPFMISLAQGNFTWDAFLKGFGRYSECLPQCSEVMRDMAQPARFADADFVSRQNLKVDQKSSDLFEQPETEDAPVSRGGDIPLARSVTFFTPFTPIEAVKPSVRTWSILLHAFLRHHQLDAAEKTLELMRHHGMEPNGVTWNGLIRTSAMRGDRDDVLDCLDNMEKAGITWDRYTVRAMQNDHSAKGIGRVGLGDRVKGGGLVTGHRLEHGGFEFVDPQKDDISTLQIENEIPQLT